MPDAQAARRPGCAQELRALQSLARRMDLRFKDWLKLLVAFALHPGAVRAWLALLDWDPVLRRIDDARLLSKVTRPYLDQALSLPERVCILSGHYRWLHARGMGAWPARLMPRRSGSTNGRARTARASSSIFRPCMTGTVRASSASVCG
ncbi:DUF535 family protein [Mitsuaria sp. WAJ17]|nr:DUF535 family protein [Mitsuaria sp. WAJ17]